MNIRVGKDICLVWSILTEGLPEPLEGRPLRLDVTDPSGTVTAVPFSVVDNKVEFNLYGKELTKTGAYTLTLWENKGEVGQTAVDCVSAFRLVANTLLEDDEEEGSNMRAVTLDLGHGNLERATGVVTVEGGGGAKGARHIKGAILLTVTGNTIEVVSAKKNSSGDVYRCYWKKSLNGEATGNLWNVGDQAVCCNHGCSRMYWRLVTGTDQTEGEDIPGYHFVDLSAGDCVKGSAEPQEKDEIVQLGYRGENAPERQCAIILSGEGEDTPYIRQYTGIKSYTLPDAELQIRPGDIRGLKNFVEWPEVEDNILQLQLDLIDIQNLLGLARKEIEENAASIAEALREAKDAQERANDAAIDAADAMKRFEEIADDEIISVAEKHVLRTELARINADHGDIQNELEQYEVENEETLWAAYDTAYKAFKADLETKISTPGNVSVGDLLTLQDTYYDQRTLLLDGIYKAAKALAEKANNAVALVEQSVKDVQSDVDTANTVAGEAKAAAEQAKTDAKNAQDAADSAQGVAEQADAKFDSWAADDVISPVERKGIKDELAFVVADYNNIQNQIDKYSLADTETDKSIANFVKYYDWYKGNLEYVLNPTNEEDIDESGAVKIPAAMNDNQDGYYAARTALLERIATAAKAVADNAAEIANRAEEKAKQIDEIRDNITAQMETLEDKMVGVEGNVAEINARLDGVVENYFLPGAPTFENEPAKSWIEAGGKEPLNHVGDTYTNINPFTDDNGEVIDKDAGKSWRWCYCTDQTILKDIPYTEITIDGITYKFHWHPIADSDAVLALQKAAEAMTNADGRARTFVTKAQPVPPYDEGDLWLQGSDGDIMVCKQGIHRPKNDPTPTDELLKDWEKAGKYVDNDGLADFFDGAFNEAIQDVQNQIDGKAETWYQEEDPSVNWKDNITRDKHLGDLWYKPSAQKNYMYSLLDPSGYGWKEIDGVPDGVYDYVDTKAQIFVGPKVPSPPYHINDLWLVFVDGKPTVIKRCKASRTQGTGVESDWELACGYTDDSALKEFIDGSFKEVASSYETLKGNVDKAAEDLKNVYTKAEADGKITDAEAKAIAEAKAALGEAKKELEEYTKNQIDGLATGSQNLIMNSGFTGGFEVVALNSGSTLRQMFEMFNESLEYWTYTDKQVEATTSEYTQTGKAASLYGGSLSQSIIHDIYPDKDYVLSFSAKGSGVNVTFGGVSKYIPLTANWDRYVWKLKTAASFTDKTLQFVPSGSMTIGDIKLEEGTIPSDWSISPYDNRSTFAKFEEGAYLQELLKVPTKIDPNSGFIETGVVNAGIIQMGDYAAGVMTKVTAGMSGNWQDDHSVAFFGGGSYAEAITAVSKYKSNPQYQPTEGELAKMAKAVITHGGRAILQDAIVRGSIYAENGYFRGDVYADNGYFKGTVEASAVYTKMKTLVVPGKDIEYVIGETDGDPIYPFYTCEQYESQSYTGRIILPLASKYLGMELSFLPTRRPNSTQEYFSWTLVGAVNGYDKYGYERLDPIMTVPGSGSTPSIQNYAYSMNSNFKVRRFVATMYASTAVWMELRENS